MVVLVVVVLGSAAIALVGFALYLAFCAFVVVRTGSTEGLRDVAVAILAFAWIGHLGSRSRRGPSLSLPAATGLDQAVQDGVSGEPLQLPGGRAAPPAAREGVRPR